MGRLSRFAAMDTREIVYRVQEKFRSETERLRYRYAPIEPVQTNQVFDNFKNYLLEKAEPHFYFRAAGIGREQRLDLIRQAFPSWIDHAVEEADRICLHKVRLLGLGEIELGDVIDWHRDPVTGRSWLRRFWSDYDLVLDSEAGDPKVIHELNRHRHIVDLAKAYFLTCDERYSQEALAQLQTWIDQNPPSVGINWQSSLEIGIRAISWIWTIFLLLPSRSMDDAAALRIGRSLFAQIDHIDRFPSLFSSPNTHLIGEATALFVAGTVFHGVEHAARWQKRGADWLIREMERQVTHDGVHGELSSYYHCYTVDFFLQALTLSKINGFEFPDWMWKRLDLMMTFLKQFSRTDGTLPLFGDDDGGRALAIVPGDYRSAKFSEEMFWLTGETSPCLPPPGTHTLYPAAGYAIQRSGWGPHESQVIFDCGGLGMLNGGHGHADALSFVLNVGATEILADPGTHVYNGSPEWRNFFRSTRAHNTVVIDETDQAIPDGTFQWHRKTQCRVLQHLSNESFDYVEAEHDGYRDAPGGIVHRRLLLHVRSGLWVVVDDMRGDPEQTLRKDHKFDFYFHFPSKAKVSVQQESSAIIRVDAHADSAHLQLLMCASAIVQGKTIAGQVDPIQGWVSPLYGEKAPAPTVRLSMQTRAPASGMFIMVPSHSGADPNPVIVTRPVSVTGGSALVCEAEQGEVKDVFVSSVRDQRIGVMDFNLSGRFFWLRKTGGRLTSILGIDCKEVRRGSEVFMSDEVGKPHFEWKAPDAHPGGVQGG